MEIKGGGTPKTSKSEYWNGNIPWISVTDFNNGSKYIYKTERTITEEGLKKSSTRILKKDELLISARGTIGAIAVLSKDMAFNQTCYGLNAKVNLTTNDFLYYLLKANIDQFLNFSYGAVFDTITRETFNHIFVSIPSLSEQKAIASVLSSLDDKIELLQKQNEALEKITEIIFRSQFIDNIDNKFSNGILNDVINLLYGKGLKQSERSSGIFPVVGSNGIVDYNNNYLVEAPGIVIGRKGTLGKVNYLFDNFFPIDTTFYVKAKRKNSTLIYEYFLLKSLDFSAMNTDSAVPGLNRRIALAAEIIIPPEESIISFENITNSLFQKILSNNKQLAKLTNFRDSLLPKLMSAQMK